MKVRAAGGDRLKDGVFVHATDAVLLFYAWLGERLDDRGVDEVGHVSYRLWNSQQLSADWLRLGNLRSLKLHASALLSQLF